MLKLDKVVDAAVLDVHTRKRLKTGLVIEIHGTSSQMLTES
jgi:hypothetical protein